MLNGASAHALIAVHMKRESAGTGRVVEAMPPVCPAPAGYPRLTLRQETGLSALKAGKWASARESGACWQTL